MNLFLSKTGGDKMESCEAGWNKKSEWHEKSLRETILSLPKRLPA